MILKRVGSKACMRLLPRCLMFLNIKTYAKNGATLRNTWRLDAGNKTKDKEGNYNSMETKQCAKCKEVKSLTEYFINKVRGQLKHNYRCKLCTREGWASLGSRWSGFNTQARRDEIEVSITREQWEHLVAQQCDYCNGPLPTFGRGLDRIDFTKGYHIDNVVPCCGVCNEMRGRAYSYEEQKIFGQAVARIRSLRSDRGQPPPGKKNHGGSTKGETQKEKRARTKRERMSA